MVKLPIKYREKAVSAFSGMRLMKDFIDKSGILSKLSSLYLPVRGSNRAYDPVKLIESFMLNRIKELKKDFGLDCFCLKDFWATQVSFGFIMLAYNLMALFDHVALNENKRATLKTVRCYCFALEGWVGSYTSHRVLKISLPKKKRPWMDAIFRNIEDALPPFSVPNA